jgi:large subunit ribosomal protein L6
MSRIGQMPVSIPPEVTVGVDGGVVSVSGPKGSLTQVVPRPIEVALEDGIVHVKRPSDAKTHKCLHGLTRTLIANMVRGVSEGYQIVLEVRGVGYRAEVKGKTLVLSLGFSHPVEIEPAEGIEFAVEAGTLPGSTERYFAIFIRGCDKQVVGQQAAQIRKWRRPEPYKGKGIRYRGERVRKKAGKAGKAGG